jgi:hypothetical protein
LIIKEVIPDFGTTDSRVPPNALNPPELAMGSESSGYP